MRPARAIATVSRYDIIKFGGGINKIMYFMSPPY